MAEDIPRTSDGVGDGEAKTSTNADESIQTLQTRTVARGAIWQETYIRDFPPRFTAADRQGLSLSADNLASNPMEDLLAALGACLTRSIHAAALAQDIPVDHIEVSVEADMQRSARWAAVGRPAPIGFETIKVLVQIESTVPRKILSELVKTTALWSPVANTLFNPTHLDVRLVDSD